ncbi:hypothetical protein EYF80_052670 [Liparis tanakae]|uniref:Uncharacterized protein n=1 Tax=Liparis tanakae TaxID=230148 RepID=A0A4Z2F7N6_9TELE|nr:hypothetical protein EYF80_052670 [Liparis tanakae]
MFRSSFFSQIQKELCRGHCGAQERVSVTSDLEHGDDGPEQRVEVLAVGNRVSVLRLEAELTAEQMHPQNTVGDA